MMPSRYPEQRGPLLLYIQCYYAQRGYAPAIRDIGRALGDRLSPMSLSLVYTYVRRLSAEGFVLTPLPRASGSTNARIQTRPVVLGWATVQGRELPVFPVAP